MRKVFNTYTAGEIIKYIRNENNLTREKFSDKINKKGNWLLYKESNKKRIYIDDFINILKTFNYEIIFNSSSLGSELKILNHSPKDLLRFIREATNKTQAEFAKEIGYKSDWSYSNEAGHTKYYANDLLELTLRNNYKIILEHKEQ